VGVLGFVVLCWAPPQSSPDSTLRKEAQPALRQALRALIEAGRPELYARIEHEAIVAAHKFCHRNQVHTAALLGITRKVLRAQLKRFGLLPDRSRQAANEANAFPGPDALRAAPSITTGDLTPCAA
jgi:sigma-54 dependent transcriptional regulator